MASTLSLPLYLSSISSDFLMFAQTTKTGPLTSLSALLHTRKARHAIFALFALISISVYTLFLAHPALSLVPFGLRGSDAGHSLIVVDSNVPIRWSPRKQNAIMSGDKTPAPLQLDQAQELAAVSSFLASLPQNVIPSSVDPTKPIDPHLVLDFDTRSPQAAEEVQSMVDDVWLRNPVMLYCRHWSIVSRELKSMLGGMNLSPPPTIFDVDLRDDAQVLGPLITRLTTTELPVLLIGGKPVGSISDIRALKESGELQTMIAAAGAVVDGEEKRKRRRRHQLR